MALITPDISEVVEVKPGHYPARIVGSDVKQTKDGSGVYVAWNLEIFGSEEEPALNGKRLPILNTMTAGPGAFGIKDLFKAVTGEEMTPGTQLHTENFHGREVYVTVRAQKDDPERMQVSKVRRYQGQPLTLVA